MLSVTDRQVIADHLSHSTETARRDYVDKINPHKASKAYRLLRSLVDKISTRTTENPDQSIEDLRDNGLQDGSSNEKNEEKQVKEVEHPVRGLACQEKAGPSIGIPSRSRRKWNESDTKATNDFFGSTTGKLGRDKVISQFEKEDSLKHILAREGR